MNVLVNTPPRDQEDHLLDKCVAVSLGQLDSAVDAHEANVFRVAGMVLQSSHPMEAAALTKVAKAYFEDNPLDLVQSAQVVRNRWVTSLPRLRDFLIVKFKRGNKG